MSIVISVFGNFLTKLWMEYLRFYCIVSVSLIIFNSWYILTVKINYKIILTSILGSDLKLCSTNKLKIFSTSKFINIYNIILLIFSYFFVKYSYFSNNKALERKIFII